VFLILSEVLTQKTGQDIFSGFQESIKKFIEKIAGLKKNMKTLAAKEKDLEVRKTNLKRRKERA